MGGVGGAPVRAGSPATPGADADAARAAAGAPVVAVPDESVGGPSVVETGVDSVGDVVDPPPIASVAPAAAAPATAGPAAPSGGLDTDAIRRAWPTVLGRIFTMRRLTWTFVSQNAQVMAFDGRTLTLGIATAGLTTTFRSGNHSEVVRQALIDELGVDAVVDGVHVEDISQQPAVAPPAGAVPSENATTAPFEGDSGQSGSAVAQGDSTHAQGSSGSHGGPGPDGSGGSGAGGTGSTGSAGSTGAGGSWGDAGAGHDPRGASRDTAGPGSAGPVMAEAGLSPMSSRSLQDNAGWGSPAGPAPDWATAPAAAGPGSAASGPGVAGSSSGGAGPAPAGEGAGSSAGTDARHARGASAVRESFAAARSASARRDVAGGAGPGGGRGQDPAPAAPVTDDSAVSDDDEDIEQSGDVGRTVIEKVLGGRFVSETTD
jgi:DNA polymerase-3 subunit gamma/tau